MKYTIIITIYNKEKYLEKAIKSACTQSYNKYEVIVVNDGSTDGSEEIILKLQKHFKFKYYKKENTGVADTRNYAIKKVKTPYFLFLDADDYLDDNLLEVIDKYPNYDVLSFNAINKNENGDLIKKINKPIYQGRGEKYIELLIKNKETFTVPWGYVYSTDYFKKNNYNYLKGEILEDFELTPFIIAEAKNIISIDYYGYVYITNSKSIVNNDKNTNLITKTYLKHYKKMLNKINNSNYSEQLKINLRDLIAGAIIWYGSTLDKINQVEYIKEVNQLNVTNNLNKKIIMKAIIKLCYKLKVYYPIRKYYCKFYIDNKIENILNKDFIFYGDLQKCKQIAYVLKINKPTILSKKELQNTSNKTILLCDLYKKNKNNKYINLKKIYKLLDNDYKKSYKSNNSFKSIIKRILIIFRPRITTIKIINKIPVKLLKPSEMLIKTLNSSPKNIFCSKLENNCYIDKYGDIYSCCPGWAIIPFGNILKENYYNNYVARIIKLSSINKTFCFCNLTKCKHKLNSKVKIDLNNISYSEYPKEITVSYDQSCNLKCLSCRKKYYKAKGKDLVNANKITNKIIESNWLNQSDIVLAGQGEVFYSNVYKSLLTTDNKRKNINILSNGTLFNKKNFDLIKNKYKEIIVSISIDAATEETYKKLRCGNFNILINNLKNIGNERKNNNIKKFQLNYVVQKDNYKEMEKFIKLAKTLNVDVVQFTKLGDWGTYSKKEYLEKRLISKENILDYDFYKELQKNIYKDKIVDIDSFKEELEKSKKYYGDKYE